MTATPRTILRIDSSMRHDGSVTRALAFMGIEDVEFIPADRLATDAEAAIAGAEARIEALAA